ncbi:MAG: ribonuclease H-like domain-containing protein [Acidaminobacteraceae bacterium]
MKILKTFKKVDFILPNIFDIYNLNDIAILDIETTGLHRIYSKVILVGIIIFSKSRAEIIQIFADNPSEEGELLITLQDVIKNKSLILTYNGQAFDIPFLNGKYSQRNLNFEIPMYKNFDLLRLIRKNKKNLKLANYKLKSVEDFLGIYRKDSISGKESVDLYNQYVQSRSSNLRNKILLHNFEDILNIIDLVKIFEYCEESSIYDEFKYPLNIDLDSINKVDVDHITTLYSRNYNDTLIKIYMNETKVLKNSISISFYAYSFSNHDLEYHRNNISLTYDLENLKLKLTLPTLSFDIESGTYVFLDIDSIMGENNFNSLSTEEKFNLNFLTNSKIDYNSILAYLDKYFLDIMLMISKK